MLSACTVKFSLGSEESYQHFCAVFAEALIGIHACEHKIPVVGVQYTQHETCPVSTGAVSAHAWAPLEAEANPPVSHNFPAPDINSGIDADHREQEAGVSGHWAQDAHSLSFHHGGDYAVLEACPTHSLEAQITSQNITWKLMEWKKSSDKMIFYPSSGHEVCFWTWKSEAEEPFS